MSRTGATKPALLAELSSLPWDTVKDTWQRYLQDPKILSQLNIAAFGTTILSSIIRNCKDQAPDLIKLLIKHGAQANQRDDEDGAKPFMAAAEEDNVAALAALKEAGAEVNATDNNKYTALHYAIRKGAVDATKYLLGIPVASETISSIDTTPLLTAIALYHAAIVRLLVQHGVNPNTKIEDGECPLIVALLQCYPGRIQAFIDENEDDDEARKSVPFLTAAAQESVKVLLNAPTIDVTVVDKYRNSTLYHAQKLGLEDIARLILSKNPSVKA